MRRTVRAAAAASLVAVLTGCAYYNGMYNARRAQRQAERLDREGRTAEARDQWQRAETHAESVAVRHPRSRWAEEARLLSALALVHLGDNSGAVAMLDQAVRDAESGAQRAAALTLRGRANLALARGEAARADLDSAVAEPAGANAEARFWRGEALLAVGRPRDALAEFAASDDPRAPAERARVLLVLGDAAAAVAQLDALAERGPYDGAAWGAMLDSADALGAGAGAGRLTDRLVTRRDLTAGQRARLLLDDGRRRLARGDTAGARERLRGALAAAPDSVEAQLGAVRLLQLDLAAAGSDSAFRALGVRLARLAESGGATAREAQATSRLLGLIGRLEEDTEVPDACGFLRAEILRDSIGAVPLAAAGFAQLARRWPASPWAPKALLAAIAAGHPAADSLRSVLGGRYAGSPYFQAALGHGDAAVSGAYAVLEDSLRRSLALVVAAAGSAAPGVRPGEPAPAGARPGASPRPASSRPDTLLLPLVPW